MFGSTQQIICPILPIYAYQKSLSTMKNWSVIAAAVLLHSTFGSAERQISIHEGERALTAEEKAAVAKEDLSMPSLETSMSMDTADNLWYWNWGGNV